MDRIHWSLWHFLENESEFTNSKSEFTDSKASLNQSEPVYNAQGRIYCTVHNWQNFTEVPAGWCRYVALRSGELLFSLLFLFLFSLLKFAKPNKIWQPTSAETRIWRKQLAAMLALYTSKGMAPEVNLTECIWHMPLPSEIRLPTLTLKPRGDITISPKQWYQWLQKMDMCPTKI